MVTTNHIWTIRNIEIAKHIINNAQTIAICGHKNPDGDSLGALLSLGLGLESLGKAVFMVCEDSIPRKYRALPGVPKLLKNLHRTVDIAIAVDCGSKEMIGSNYEIFERAGTVIEIDHHRSRIPFGDVFLVDADASSAGELVYELLLELEIPISIQIAQNLLTSLIVETNSFRLPGIRSRTFELCAELLKTGVDFYKLSEAVYWITPKETALLSGICMSKCKFSQDGEIAWATISLSDFKKIGASDADADPVAEKLRSIQGVKIAILFREKENKLWRVSLRSKDGINLSSLAEKFGGGGHNSAAGCTIPKKETLKKKIILSAEDLLKKHYQTKDIISPAETPRNAHKFEKKQPLPEIVFCKQLTSQNSNSVHWNNEEDDIPYFSKSLGEKYLS